MSIPMSMSQYPHPGYPAGPGTSPGVSPTHSPGVSPGANPKGHSAPQDTGYLAPSEGFVPFRSSAGSGSERTFNEQDSGVVDVDGVNLADRASYKNSGQYSPSRPLPQGIVGHVTTPPVGTKAHPHPAALPIASQPGAMRRPESLARGHEYEELPITRYQDPSSYSYSETDGSGGRPRPLAVERLVSANGTNSVTSTDSRDLLFDTNHNDRVPSPYRKRENPLYDSADRVRQSSLEEKTKPSLCSCPFVLIIFFSIVAVLAFLLAALAMGGITGDNSPRTAALVTPSSQLKEALDRLQTLEVQYMALQNKVKSLEDTDVNILSSNISSQSKKILQLEETLAVYKTTLQNQYLSLQANFSHRIDMVSKMPGPPGAGNLTLCQYKKLSVGEPSSKDTSETKFVPDTEQAANDWVITGLECSVNGGTQASLVSAREWNTDKFKCICSGKTGGLNRFCELHYWRCPRIS